MDYKKWVNFILSVIIITTMAVGCQSKQVANTQSVQSIKPVKLTKDFKFDKKKTAYFIEGLQGETDSPISVPNAYYFTYGMQALGHDIKKAYRARLISFIKASQKKDGGFGWDKRAANSDTFDTFCAVWTLKHIGALDKVDTSKAEKFILGCKNKDGGFGFAQGQASTLPNTYYSIAALDLLGKSSAVDRSAVIGYIDDLKTAQGGYGVRKDALPNVQSTYAALHALKVLNALDKVDKAKTVAFIEQDQSRGGGYGYMVGETVAPVPENTYYAVSSLRILGAMDKVKASSLSAFLRDRYTFDGGFCDVYSGNSQYPSTYYGVASLVELGHLKDPEINK